MKLNTIYRGDCNDILNDTFTRVDDWFAKKGIGLDKEWADLVYMDPPFFSNRDYEQPWGDEKKTIGFADNQWGYGVDGLIGKYLPYMRERIQRCYNVLKPTGSFYLHCDWHASHYLKRLCDDIFGYNKFQNEIIWRYGLGGSSPRRYQRKHDSILFYTKTDNWNFFPPMVPATSNRMKGELKKMDDVWDIPTINNMAKERLGYPTQKPEELLIRIISASSKEGDIVLDPFCGCGTTVAAAHLLKRKYIGIDVSEKACKIVIDRLRKIGAYPEFADGVYDVVQLKSLSPFAFQDYVIQICLKGHSNIKKSSDKGIDGFSNEEIPVQVKQSKIGRPVVDEFETAIDRYYNQLGNGELKKRGIIVCDGIPPDSVWREIADAKKQRNIFIDVLTIQDCCDLLNKRYRQSEKSEGWL